MRALLPAVAVVAALAAGCGSDRLPSVPPSAGSPTASPDPLVSRTPAAPGAPVALRTDPLPHPPDSVRVSVPWQFVRLERDRRLYLGYGTGGCTSQAWVDVMATRTAVTVAVRAYRRTGDNVVCPAYQRVVYGWVALRAPLGSRQLLHAPVTAGG